MIGKLGYLLTLPVLGGVRLVRSVAGVIEDEAERQLTDEDAIRGELLELHERFGDGLLDEAEYERLEETLLVRLNTARARKA